MLDLEHLARQTMDDNALQSEILQLFHQQLILMRDEILSAKPDARINFAHRLVGSARAVGAFALAQAAEAMIDQPEEMSPVETVVAKIDALSLYLQAMAERQINTNG